MQAAHVALLRELLLAQRRESLVRTATSLGLRLGLDLSWFSNIADEAVMAVASGCKQFTTLHLCGLR